jgi:hypothetical protein
VTDAIELWIDGWEGEGEEFCLRNDIGKRIHEVFVKNGYKVVGLELRDDWNVTVKAVKR